MSSKVNKNDRSNQADKNKNKFDKRSYLKQKLKSNFGSQQEGHGRAFLQKKSVVRQYYRKERREEQKQQKKLNYEMSKAIEEGGSSNVSLPSKSTNINLTDPTSDQEDEDSPFYLPPQKKKLNSMQKARAEYHKKIAEKRDKHEDFQRRQIEIEEAKKKYKEKRLQRFKKLSKKTRRGQPVMSGRIELMLEQLQQEMKT